MVCTNPRHPFSYPPRETMYRDLLAADRRINNLERTQQGHLGGIAYALRLLNSPPLHPDGAPINLLAAQVVLQNMLDGKSGYYVSMAKAARQPEGGATEHAGGG